jgi:hypothetical protein
VFGAKIGVSMPDRGLYLVIGREVSPVALVSALNGQVVFQVPNSPRLLAVMPVSAFFSLRQHHDIAHVGPVTIHSERFNRFLELIGLNNHNRIKEVTGDDPT